MKKTAFKIGLTLIGFLAIQCSKQEPEKVEVLRPINYVKIGSDAGLQTRTFNGTAKAGNQIELSFRESGIIQKTNASTGKRVKKGDLIATLDNVEAKLNFQRSVNEVISAESAMNTSKAEFDRVKLLYEKGSTPLRDYQSAKNNYESARSGYEVALRNQEIQRSRLNYGVIYSPGNGVVANTSGKVNERVSAGHVFAVLNVGEKKKVELNLPENVINEVSVGMKVQVEFTSMEGSSFSGEVIEVSPITSENATTYPVDIEIENATDQIRPGMAARVIFDFSQNNLEQSEKIVVPIKAVGEDGNGNFVFLIEKLDDQSGIAKRQHIEIGEITTNGFEVVSGLEKGQLIATAGLQTLLDGQKVRLD